MDPHLWVEQCVGRHPGMPNKGRSLQSSIAHLLGTYADEEVEEDDEVEEDIFLRLGS